MLVARFWAEHRARHRIGRGPQTTIRRWGWSNSSQAEAESLAQRRAEAALAEALTRAGSRRLDRRERKVAYNGADGVPIREEILAEHPDLEAVVTRNQYGAHCLNVRDVLFADIDLAPTVAERDVNGCVGCFSLILLTAALVVLNQSPWPLVLSAILIVCLIGWRLAQAASRRLALRSPEWIRAHAQRWCDRHTDWSLHLYRTPAGYRLLAEHARLDPQDPETTALFAFFRVDPTFAAMCCKQRCFRARLTGKPWRMGVAGKMSWSAWPPTTDEARQRRAAWIVVYEQHAIGFAACRYLGQIGSATTDPRAAAIRRLHDVACRAQTDLPLA